MKRVPRRRTQAPKPRSKLARFASALEKLPPIQQHFALSIFEQQMGVHLFIRNTALKKTIALIDPAVQEPRSNWSLDDINTLDRLFSQIDSTRTEKASSAVAAHIKSRNQKFADNRSRITSASLREAWQSTNGTYKEKIAIIAKRFNENPESLARRIRRWVEKGRFPRTRVSKTSSKKARLR